ncbi:hypothetical protein EY915_15660 [Citrobacter braakii]|nr:hypothetical protein EY915_15660 [Citrobacter braakii]
MLKTPLRRPEKAGWRRFAFFCLYTLNIRVAEGGDAGHPRERTPVRDRGERGEPTYMQLEI